MKKFNLEGDSFFLKFRAITFANILLMLVEWGRTDIELCF